MGLEQVDGQNVEFGLGGCDAEAAVERVLRANPDLVAQTERLDRMSVSARERIMTAVRSDPEFLGVDVDLPAVGIDDLDWCLGNRHVPVLLMHGLSP